jgi:hypothetical protein
LAFAPDIITKVFKLLVKYFNWSVSLTPLIIIPTILFLLIMYLAAPNGIFMSKRFTPNKYVYYFYEECDSINVRGVVVTHSVENAIEIRKYYAAISLGKYQLIGGNQYFYLIPAYEKVMVIKHKRNLGITKIKFYQHEKHNDSTLNTGWIPDMCLHDSIMPAGIVPSGLK